MTSSDGSRRDGRAYHDSPVEESNPDVLPTAAGPTGGGDIPGSREEAGTPKGPGSAGTGADAPDTGSGGPAGPADRRPRRTAGRFLFEALTLLLMAALMAVFIQSFLIKAFLIPSSSMSPTLEVGDRVMVERVTYLFREPRRGEMVVFRYPPDAPEAMNTTNRFYWPLEQIGETLRLAHRGVTPYVKRVVATGGETLELRKGKLFIDGKEIVEDYAVEDGSDYGPVNVPEGVLFCVGDNRANSRDSRYWGTVPTRSVIGRVFLTWWPASRWRTPR